MSSELAPSFVFTLQPGLLRELASPTTGPRTRTRWTRLTCPSSRAFCWMSSRLVPSPEICSALLPLPPPPPPQPAAAKARKTTQPARGRLRRAGASRLYSFISSSSPVRLRTCALGATRGGPAGRGPRAPRLMSFRGSVVTTISVPPSSSVDGVSRDHADVDDLARSARLRCARRRPGVSCSASMRIFSGRTVKRLVRPFSVRSRTFETPTKPGHELGLRVLVDLRRAIRPARSGPR